MKILGIGVDIVENKRLKNSIKNKSFISRLFTLLEIKNSRLVKDKSIYFSKKFAAKESFSKALGTGFRKGLNFKDVENRNLKRLAGLCNINKCDSYKFPCEFSDYYVEGESIFNNIQSNESNYIDEKKSNINEDINNLINKKGLIVFILAFIKLVPSVFIKKILSRFK